MERQILYLLMIIFFYLNAPIVFSQKYLSLQECIDLGLQNNMDLKNAQYLKEGSRISINQAKLAMVPEFGISLNGGLATGRSINPYTNSFVNQNLTFSNVSAQLNVPIYNGLKLKSAVEKSKLDEAMNNWQAASVAQKLETDIILAYSNVLNGELQKEVLQKRMVETKRQLDRFIVMENQVVGSQSDVQNFKGQYAADQISIANMDNQIALNLNTLKNLINTTESIQIQREDVVINPLIMDEGEILSKSSEGAPSIRAAEYAVSASVAQLKVVKADFYPTISLFGQLNSNFSSAAERFIETGTEERSTGDYVNINSQRIPVLTTSTNFRNEVIGFASQINNNLNSAVGLSVFIPISSIFSTKNRVSFQKNLIDQARSNFDASKVAMNNVVSNVLINYKTQFNSIALYEAQLSAFTEAYRIEEVKYNNGVTNFASFIAAKNNMDNTSLNLVNAKIQTAFWYKVLDVYLQKK